MQRKKLSEGGNRNRSAGLEKRWNASPARTAFGALALIAIIAAGLIRGWVRNAEWHDNGALFASAYGVHPSSAPVLYCYAQWLAERGDLREAAKLLSSCVRIAPGLTDAQVTLGKTLLALGDAANAVSAFENARMQLPGYPGLSELLRNASHLASTAAQEQIDRERRNYEQAPSELHTLVSYKNALLSAGRVEDADRLMREAENRFSDRPEFWAERAALEMLAGRRDEGVRFYRRALQINPAAIRAAIELGMALLDRGGAGDRQEAATLIEAAYKRNPQDVQARIAGAELLVLEGRRKEAISIYESLLREAPPAQREQFAARLAALGGQRPDR